MLAYTNRFLALATLIRNLHTKYKQGQEDKELIKAQITNLRKRLTLVKSMQGKKMPFDVKRMAYGGFKVIVDM